MSALLLALSTMLHMELPHVNVLSKIDLINSYGKLGALSPVMARHGGRSAHAARAPSEHPAVRACMFAASSASAHAHCVCGGGGKPCPCTTSFLLAGV